MTAKLTEIEATIVARMRLDPAAYVATRDGSTVATHAEALALCSAMALPAEAVPPEWTHLLPAGQVRTMDDRGPYIVADAPALARASMESWSGGRAPIDENHATDLAAPRGEPSPARGWIVELQARQNGIWGRVDWSPEGKVLIAGRGYRFISPVITHRKDNTVTGILRASLVNTPNIKGMVALHGVLK